MPDFEKPSMNRDPSARRKEGISERVEALRQELADVEAQIERASAEAELSQARKILVGMESVKGALAELSGAEGPAQKAAELEEAIRAWMSEHTPDEALLARRRELKQLIGQAAADVSEQE